MYVRTCVVAPSCFGRLVVTSAVREISSDKERERRDVAAAASEARRDRESYVANCPAAPGTPSRSIMRDMAGKIAELKFEAPLARFEEEDTASLKNMNLLTGAAANSVFLPLVFLLSPRRLAPSYPGTHAPLRFNVSFCCRPLLFFPIPRGLYCNFLLQFFNVHAIIVTHASRTLRSSCATAFSDNEILTLKLTGQAHWWK